MLDHLRSRLAPEPVDLLAAVVAALNGPGEVGALEGLPLWQATAPEPLDAPWPAEPQPN